MKMPKFQKLFEVHFWFPLALVTGASVLFAQESGVLTVPLPSLTVSPGLYTLTVSPEQYVQRTPDGRYSHLEGTSITVVEVSEGGLTLECVRPSGVMYFGVGPALSKETRWREVYVVRDGKLALDRVQRPKITSPTAERVEWGTDDIKVGK